MTDPALLAAVTAADTANKANLAALGTLGTVATANEAAAAQVRDADLAVSEARNALSAAAFALEAAATKLDAAAAITQTAAGKVATASSQVTAATSNAQATGAALSKAGTELALLAVAPPPVVEPPPIVVEPPPPTPTPGPAGFGCPPTLALTKWTYQAVTGAGRPTAPGGGMYSLIPEWKAGMKMSGVDFDGHGQDGFQTELGICSGYYGDQKDIELKNSIVRNTKKWGARLHKVVSMREEYVTTMDGVEEHDRYIEPVANGFTRAQNQAAYEAALAGGTVDMAKVCYLSRKNKSLRSASQVLQSAQRDRDGLSAAQMGECGLIWIDGMYAENHARHKADGGIGSRQSQAIKVFEGEKGPEGSAVALLYKGFVLVQDMILDDSMQTYSFGALYIGPWLGGTIRRCIFRGGSSNHPNEKNEEPVRISDATGLGAGLVLIEDCTIEFKGTQGIHLYDLKRPLELRNVKTNLRLIGPTGQTIKSPDASGILNYKQGA